MSLYDLQLLSISSEPQIGNGFCLRKHSWRIHNLPLNVMHGNRACANPTIGARIGVRCRFLLTISGRVDINSFGHNAVDPFKREYQAYSTSSTRKIAKTPRRHFQIPYSHLRVNRSVGIGISEALLFIQPGKPSEKAFIERFNRSFRQQVLDPWPFNAVLEVKSAADDWLIDYKECRPHDSLGRLHNSSVCERHQRPVITYPQRCPASAPCPAAGDNARFPR